MTIRRILTAAICCFMLTACGEKEQGKLGNSNTTENNETNQENSNTENSSDPCAGLELCMASGASCDGNTHVICQVNSDSCIVKTSEIACTAPEVCDPTLGCVEPGDCTDDPGCDGAADGDASCDGTELVECAMGADGCMDATRTDCADTGEVCDDADDPAECVMVPATCGNGALDAGEGCDDGNNANGDGCDANCMVEPFCGDNNVDAGEQCDDGNNANGDGCDANCMVEPFCGDNNVDAGEQCDDGNNANGDGCDANCMVEPFCGDNNVDAGEQCDDGNNANGDGCDANCMLEPFCGDNNVDAGEQCDDGNNANGDGCDANCMLESVCGDGTLDAGEGCDDGNNLDGDGCNANCQPELGYDCDATGCTMWPTFNPQTSTTFTSGTPPEGGVMFTSGGGLYDCTIDANTTGDPDVFIYDSAGMLLDSYTRPGNEFFWDRQVPAGNYYIAVESVGAMPLDGFTIECFREPIDLGTFAPGTNLSLDSMTAFGRGPLEAGNTHNFTFDIPAGQGQMLDVDVSAMNAADDFDIEFRDSQGNQLLDVNVANSNTANIFLRPGSYRMRIRNHVAIAAALATYTLILTSNIFTPFNVGSFAAGDPFPPLSGGSCTAGEAFFLRFGLTTAATVDFLLNGWTVGNMFLFIWGLNGIIASSTTAGFEAISALSLVAGTYFLVLLCVEAADAHAVQGNIQ